MIAKPKGCLEQATCSQSQLPDYVQAAIGLHTGSAFVTSSSPPFLIEYVNKGWTELCGFSEADASQQSPKMLHGMQTDRNMAQAFTRTLMEQGSASMVIVNYTKRGRPFWHSFESKELTDASGQTTHYIAYTEERPESQQGNLIRVGSELSHTMQLPLKALLNAVGDGASWPAEQCEVRETVRSCAHAMQEILSLCVDLEEINSGQLQLHFRPFNLHELIRKIVSRNREPAMAQGVDLAVSCDAGNTTRLSYLGDEKRLLQCIDTVISCALEGTRGSGRISVNVVRHDHCTLLDSMDDITLTLAVTDIGQPSVQEKDRQRREEMWVGGRESEHRLYITRMILRQHNGGLQVASGGPDQGTTFTMTLRLQQSSMARTSTPQPPTTEDYSCTGLIRGTLLL